MARQAVEKHTVSIRLACEVFTVSETCYRYEAKQNAENERIADWLVRLTDNQRNWGYLGIEVDDALEISEQTEI